MRQAIKSRQKQGTKSKEITEGTEPAEADESASYKTVILKVLSFILFFAHLPQRL